MRLVDESSVQTGLSILPYGEEINYRLQLRNGFWESLPAEVDHAIEHLRLMIIEASLAGVLGRATAVEVGTGWVPTMPLAMALLGTRVFTYDRLARATRSDRLRFDKRVVAGAAPSFSAGWPVLRKIRHCKETVKTGD